MTTAHLLAAFNSGVALARAEYYAHPFAACKRNESRKPCDELRVDDERHCPRHAALREAMKARASW